MTEEFLHVGGLSQPTPAPVPPEELVEEPKLSVAEPIVEAPIVEEKKTKKK